MNLNLMTFSQETVYGAYVSIYGEDGAYVIHLDDKTKKGVPLCFIKYW